MNTQRIMMLALTFSLGAAACGDEAGDGGLEPDSLEPQVRTDSPLCLNQRPFPIAGQPNQYGAIITNFGEQALLVREVRITEQLRDGAFELEREQVVNGETVRTPALVGPEGEECTPQAPCRIGFREDVLMNITLTPPSPGWDRALIEVDTNDPEWPNGFPFAIVAASVSGQGSDDFGDRPSELNCVCRTPVPDECLQ